MARYPQRFSQLTQETLLLPLPLLHFDNGLGHYFFEQGKSHKILERFVPMNQMMLIPALGFSSHIANLDEQRARPRKLARIG